jgi:hypothetical protein
MPHHGLRGFKVGLLAPTLKIGERRFWNEFVESLWMQNSLVELRSKRKQSIWAQPCKSGPSWNLPNCPMRDCTWCSAAKWFWSVKNWHIGQRIWVGVACRWKNGWVGRWRTGLGGAGAGPLGPVGQSREGSIYSSKSSSCRHLFFLDILPTVNASFLVLAVIQMNTLPRQDQSRLIQD